MRQFKSARFYHESTKYTYSDIKNIYQEDPPDSKSLPVKNYSDTPGIPLEKKLTDPQSSFIKDLKNSQHFNRFDIIKDSAVSLDTVSQLLYLTNGVTLVKDYGAKKVYFRAAPSASASYPIEIYVVNNNIHGLDKGIFYYHPLLHELIMIRQGDFAENIKQYCFGLSFIENSPLFLILTSVDSRNSWRYRQRSFRYSMMEGGYIAENLALAASSMQLTVNLVGDFVDQQVNALVGISGSDERTLLIASVGVPAEKLNDETYTFGMQKEEETSFQWKPDQLSNQFYAGSSHYYPAENLVQVNVALPYAKEPRDQPEGGETILLPEIVQDLQLSTAQVIKNRRSSHNFARISIEIRDLASVLAFMSRIPAMYGYPAYKFHLVVNAVEGLVNGVYRYHAANKHKLEMVKKGTFRGDLSYLTLAQDTVFNCSAAVFISVKFDDIEIFSNRGYRYAHFNVGMLSEAAYLAGNALNLGVRGIANFFDDEINSFFKVQNPGENILGGVILGRS